MRALSIDVGLTFDERKVLGWWQMHKVKCEKRKNLEVE